MPMISTTVRCPVEESFRVRQVAGMFDVPIGEKIEETFEVELPGLEEAWTIGAVVGPSGSGKSTIVRRLWGDYLHQEGNWPADKAVVDGFPDVGIQPITAMLTAVGFSSPPSWLKPFHVLSGGEKFRCELARALLCDRPLVVFDEFTSVVDRTVARIGSAAVAKAIRGGRIAKRLVVVSCHYDILEWLGPDWTVDMATCQLARGCLRQPPIHLEVVRCSHAAWSLFARHHYLSGSLSRGATCYLAVWDDRPVAFCAFVGMPGRKGRKRVTRIVTLPDFQGVGIGSRLLEATAALQRAQGFLVSITTTHPAMIAYCRRSPHWRAVRISRAHEGAPRMVGVHRFAHSLGRCVVTFEYG